MASHSYTNCSPWNFVFLIHFVTVLAEMRHNITLRNNFHKRHPRRENYLSNTAATTWFQWFTKVPYWENLQLQPINMPGIIFYGRRHFSVKKKNKGKQCVISKRSGVPFFKREEGRHWAPFLNVLERSLLRSRRCTDLFLTLCISFW